MLCTITSVCCIRQLANFVGNWINYLMMIWCKLLNSYGQIEPNSSTILNNLWCNVSFLSEMCFQDMNIQDFQKIFKIITLLSRENWVQCARFTSVLYLLNYLSISFMHSNIWFLPYTKMGMTLGGGGEFYISNPQISTPSQATQAKYGLLVMSGNISKIDKFPNYVKPKKKVVSRLFNLNP